MPVPSAAPPAVRLMPSFDRNDRRAKGRPEPPESCPDICCLSFLGLKHRARWEWYAAVPLTSITQHNAGGQVFDLLAKTRSYTCGRSGSFRIDVRKRGTTPYWSDRSFKGVVPLFRDAPTQVSSVIK